MVDLTTITMNVREWLEEWSRRTFQELERLNRCYVDLDKKVDDLPDKFQEKLERLEARLNTKIDNLTIRLTKQEIRIAGIAAGSAILTSLIFTLVVHFLKGKV
jgi:seryl-tRNA(Sec) selenium transferase